MRLRRTGPRDPSTGRKARFRGLLALTVAALLVQAGLVVGGSSAAGGCGGTTLGIFSLDRALAATGDPCPVVEPDKTQVSAGAPVTFDASQSKATAPAVIVTYLWEFAEEGGSWVADPTTTGPIASHTFNVPGTGQARVTVIDDNVPPRTGSTVTSVTVCSNSGNPPTAALTTAPPAVVGAEQVFDASASTAADPCGSIPKYEWDLDGDGTYEPEAGTSATASKTYTAPGNPTVRVRVTDANGLTDVKQLPLRVTTRPVARLAAAPDPVKLGRPLLLDASASSDPDGPAVARYDWDLDGNGSYETPGGTSPTTTRSYALDGAYTIGVRVTDVDGATGTTTRTVLAISGRPTAVLVLSPNPPTSGQAVTLNGSGSSDPDGLPLARYQWDLDGNGSYETDTGPTPTVATVFPNSGTVDVGLKVTDAEANVATQRARVTVQDPPLPSGGGSGGSGPGAGGAAAGAGGSGSSGGGGAGSGAGGPGGGDAVGGSAGGRSLRAALGGATAQRVRNALRRGVQLTCEADRAAACSVTARIAGRDARKLGLDRKGRAYSIGSGKATLKGAGKATLSLRLASKAARALRKVRSLRVTVAGTASAAGQRVTVTRTVTLRR